MVKCYVFINLKSLGYLWILIIDLYKSIIFSSYFKNVEMYLHYNIWLKYITVAKFYNTIKVKCGEFLSVSIVHYHDLIAKRQIISDAFYLYDNFKKEEKIKYFVTEFLNEKEYENDPWTGKDENEINTMEIISKNNGYIYSGEKADQYNFMERIWIGECWKDTLDSLRKPAPYIWEEDRKNFENAINKDIYFYKKC